MNSQNTTYKVSKSEINQFYILMDHGLSIPFMIEIVFKDHKEIIRELEKGKSLNDVLFQGKDTYFQNIRLLNEVLSMKDSIECANVLDTNANGNIKKFLKESIYPIFIFFFSFGMVIFFSVYIVPSMQVYASESDSFLLLKLLKLSYEIILIVLILLFMYLFFSRNKLMVIPIVKKFNTLQFSIVLKALLDRGLSTRNCFGIMEKMKHSHSIYIFAHALMHNLEKGVSIDQILKHSIYFDESFSKFVTIGLQNSSLSSMLEIYNEKCKEDIAEFIHRLSIGVQIVSYTSVGFLVVIVYQIMLYPLNMLTSF